MCDTMVVVPERAGEPVWLAKNSDREPGEAQLVEHLPARAAQGASVACTWMSVPEGAPTAEVVLSRPAWMWGAEMGVNEHGVAIGNEAVFTRLPVAERGLTGMDLVRLALERAHTADDALAFITYALARYGQGGRAGHRNARFRYHNAFVIADRGGAWLLETADRAWAAVRVRGVRTTSNVLTIDEPPDAVGPGTLELARARGLWAGEGPFSFRAAFGRPSMAALSGGDLRRACTARALAGAEHEVERARLTDALRDHGFASPRAGLVMSAPCAHASFLPTRTSGQTTGSLVARLGPGAPRAWLTGTSSPCLSVFKPVPFTREGGELVDTGPRPRAQGADDASLFWRHERLHRAVLRAYEERRPSFEEPRAKLERRAVEVTRAEAASAVWAEHREAASEWASLACARRPRRVMGPSDVYWALESLRDGLR